MLYYVKQICYRLKKYHELPEKY